MTIIAKRIQVLEARLRDAQPPINRLRMLSLYLVGFHVGKWLPNESAAESYARAVGYETGMAMRAALRNNPEDFNARRHIALCRMFADHGVDLERAGRKKIGATIQALTEAAEKRGMHLPAV